MGCSYWMIPVPCRGPCANARYARLREGMRRPESFNLLWLTGPPRARAFRAQQLPSNNRPA
jgi:hypothetical protein